MTEFSTAIFSVSIVIISGIVAGRFADNFNFPKTIPLVLTGIFLAIFSNLGIANISIDIEAIRDMAIATAELALVAVLFREGMHLNLRNFKKYMTIILLMAVFGTILTTIIVGLTVNVSLSLSLSTALLVGAIFTPTDPAATFAALRGNGSTRIEEKYETILGGESALNDVIAIIIVVVILIPSATHATGVNITIDVIFLALYEFIGGVILGLFVGYVTIVLISYLPSRTEESMISLACAALIFGLGFLTNTSSAIGALVAGVVLSNPKIFGRPDYIKTQINVFWENITFLFEILAFIFIGAIFSLKELNNEIVLFALILSIIVVIGRFAGVYLITWILELSHKTKEDLNNRERYFIGFAGMRGLTTAILATLAYIAFGEESSIGQLILYSSILVLIFTGLFQGLFLKRVAERANVLEEVDEVAELLAQKIVLRNSLDFLLNKLQDKSITFDDFSRLSIPVKEELYILEEHLLRIQAERKKNITFIITALETINKGREALDLAYQSGEITNDLAYEKALTKLNNQKRELTLLQEKMTDKKVRSKTRITPNKIDEEIDSHLAEAAIGILKDPKISKRFGVELMNFLNSFPKPFKASKNIANQSKPKDIKKDAG
jgi:CPA1 family monovalent cation:H+ antiporter